MTLKIFKSLFVFTILNCFPGCAILSVDSYYSPGHSQIHTEKERCVNYSPSYWYCKHFGPDNIAVIYHENDRIFYIRVKPYRIYDLFYGLWVFSVIPTFGLLGDAGCNQHLEKNVIVINVEPSHDIPFDWDPKKCKISTSDGTIYSPSKVTVNLDGTYILFSDINEKKFSSFDLQFEKIIVRQVEFAPPIIHFKKSNGIVYSILSP